jgi:anti-anti-sigma factor
LKRQALEVGMPSITSTSTGDSLTLDVVGPLCGDGAGWLLERAVRRALRPRHREVRVNMAAVPAVDAAGVGRLLNLSRTIAERGLALTLVSVPPRVARLLDVLGVHRHLCRTTVDRPREARTGCATPTVSSTVGAC